MISYLFIHPCRGRGIGTKIFKELMKVAKERKASLLQLTATDMGRGLYERHTFTQVHRNEVVLEALWSTYETIAAELKPSLDGYSVRRATKDKKDIDAMVNLRGQLARFTRKIESVSDEEINFVRDFYTQEWDGQNPVILLAEETITGKIVAMAAVVAANGMPSLIYNPTSRLSVVHDVVVDEDYRCEFSSVSLHVFH